MSISLYIDIYTNFDFPSIHSVHNFWTPHDPREPRGPPGPSGLPPGWPPAPPPAGGRERVGTGNTSCERLHPRFSPPEPQLIPIPMRWRRG